MPADTKEGFVKPTKDMIEPIMKEGIGTITHTGYVSKGASDAVKQYLIKLGVIDGKTD